MYSKTLPILALLCLSLGVQAQITISSAYFPAAGDTLRTSLADSSVVVDLLTPGENRQWDFGDVEGEVNFFEAVVDASGDTLFPNADVLVRLDAFNTGYFRITDTTYALVGVQGRLDIFPDFQFTAPLEPARPQRRAPLTYGASFSSETVNAVTVTPAELPVEAQAQFGALLTSVDSIRLSTLSVRDDEVDAYGSLTLNGRVYEVLRERRTESLDLRISVKSGPLPYIDITGTIQMLAPEVADVVGEQDPQTTFYFWTNDSKEAVATVPVDEEGKPGRLTFKREENTSSVGGPATRQAFVRVYPNPAREMATFELTGLGRDPHILRVVSLLGREVTRSVFVPNGAGEARLELEVSKLPFGTYLYSVTNQRGRIMATRKLVIGH